jgi:hypothetical protein
VATTNSFASVWPNDLHQPSLYVIEGYLDRGPKEAKIFDRIDIVADSQVASDLCGHDRARCDAIRHPGRRWTRTPTVSGCSCAVPCRPFDHPEWLFELKYDGFGALLSTGGHRPDFVSRNANSLARFASLALSIVRELDADAVLDGEVVCFDREGRPRFYDLMFRRQPEVNLRHLLTTLGRVR